MDSDHMRRFWDERAKENQKGRDDRAWLGTAVDTDELTAVTQRAGMAVERLAGRGTQFCLVLLRTS